MYNRRQCYFLPEDSAFNFILLLVNHRRVHQLRCLILRACVFVGTCVRVYVCVCVGGGGGGVAVGLYYFSNEHVVLTAGSFFLSPFK